MEPILKALLKKLEDISIDLPSAIKAVMSIEGMVGGKYSPGCKWISVSTVERLLKKHWPTEDAYVEDKNG